jgi:Carboxypeptidase regulatory-like domain
MNAAFVIGATVVITNTDTNSVMTLTTNDTGYYEANLLLPGNYRVVAEMPGFKKYVFEPSGEYPSSDRFISGNV